MDYLPITLGELRRHAHKSPYLLCRHVEGFPFAINSKVLTGSSYAHLNEESRGIIFSVIRPCSFSEYISKKIGFLTSKN